MKKYFKYLYTLALLVVTISLYAVISADRGFVDMPLDTSSITLPPDTTTRFPVKKTQVTTYDDLNQTSPIDLKDPSNVETKVTYDPNSKHYIISTTVGDQEISTPYSLSADEYWDYSLKQSMGRFFKDKNAQAYENKDQKEDFSLKDMKLNIGPTDRLFGPGGVKVQTQGYVEAKMGVKHWSVDNPTISTKNRSKTIFDFDEDIQLNVNASVGDKINFGMNYDTKSMFDFDTKKIRLAYEGKEDEIIKRIEAGNVSMATTNSLINGGTALFGIHTELQFGKLRVNAVVSQQESQTQSVNTKGGAQTNEYEFKADQYDENRHFFLAHYFRDNYDKAMSKLPFVKSPVSITRMEVWITNKRSDYAQSRNIVAFADIGEYDVIKNATQWQRKGSIAAPYNGANTLYDKIVDTYPLARDKDQVTATLGFLESGQDYEKVESARLLNASEYSYNPQLGYVSLNSALQADEILAVAFEYTMSGSTYQVGEFATDIVDKYDPVNKKSGALFLRLLKPVSLSPHSYTWDLMMKNVYYLGATGIQQDRFKMNIAYQSDTLGTYINYIPDGAIKDSLLLRVMGLDRLDVRKNAYPDGIFDFLDGYTIKAENGRIYFPVVEPFGKHLYKRINNPAVAAKYTYQQLYDSTKTIAQQDAEHNKFKMYGSYRGSSSTADIQLNATNIPKGSVRVMAGGNVLTEGVDYIVDYMAGVVTILDQNIIESNIPIQTTLEDRSSMSMERKTLLGLNLSYDISKKFNVGATIMHFYEKPMTMKSTLGSESVKNTLWGVNTSYKTDSEWLTNLVDKLPFVNATQPSRIAFDGEFAHMIAGHYDSEDVMGGYSYLDDFETSESRIDMRSPYSWTLAATPYDKNGGLFPEAILMNDVDYGKNRALLSWYTIDPIFTRTNSSLTPEHIKNDKEQLSNHFVREISMREIYPNRDVTYEDASTIQTLNLSFYPSERGPYNLDATRFNSEGRFTDPANRWGGITRKIDTRDFEASNVEYIEFWLMDPFANNSTASTPNLGGDLYFNLGEISEDVLKDGKKFFENGLPTTDDPEGKETTRTAWGKVPKRQSTVYAFDDNNGAQGRARQDVGYNGLSVSEELQTPVYTNYRSVFMAALSATTLQQEMENPLSPINSPAGDLYHFYRGNDYDRNKVGVLDRYKYYNNTEGNSADSNAAGENYSTASRSTPDVEDIDQDNTLNEKEAYFQYKINLRPAAMNVGSNYIVDKRVVSVKLRNGKDEEIAWYQFKVPVRQYDTRVGGINDFRSIRFMRMFLHKFEQETFLRFGTLQLVRGDWRLYQPTLNKNETPSGSGTLDISTVNIEENGDRQPVNYILPPGLSRSLDPGQTQLIKENEQALSMKILNLDAGDARAIYKNTAYDLRRYKRMQLYTHAEELVGGPQLIKGDMTVFIRLGSDYKNNYYEYEVPLTITPAGSYNINNNSDRYIVWPADNMLDFPLDLLKNVKLNRNKAKRMAGSSISYTTPYWEYDPEKRNNRVTVVGNPSLSDVNVIMIGVRNNTHVTKSSEVWINELRLTDFDEKGGWAAQGNLNIALSDLGTVNISGRKETIGFGALDQSLLERRSDDLYMYNITANVELGKFLPEKAKVKLPLYYAYSNQTITPEYDPYDQDVKLDESLSLVNTKAERDSIKSLAQEKTVIKSIALNNVKVDIQSKTPMPYDPANFSFGYSFSETEIKTPVMVYDVAKNYRGTVDYAYSPLTKTWQPFKDSKSKFGKSKFSKALGFNYLPQNIGLRSNMTRDYTETVLRDVDSYSLGGNNDKNKFASWSQSFYWDREFTLNWNFTQNLRFNFQSGTRAEIVEPRMQLNEELSKDDYQNWKDSVMRSIMSLGNPLAYKQNAKMTYQLPFRNIPALSWISNSSISYEASYQWDRGARIEGEELGNIIRNSSNLELKNRFNLVALYDKSTYLKGINKRFDKKKAPTQATNTEEKQPKLEKPKRVFNQTVKLKQDTVTIIKHGLKTKDFELIASVNGDPYKLKYKKIDENTIRVNNKDTLDVKIRITGKDGDDQGNSVWEDVAAYSVRGLMSIRSITIDYTNRKETNIAGYLPNVGDALGQKNGENGMAPGLGFAFGFESGNDFVNKALDNKWLNMNGENIVPATFNTITKLDIRAELEPIKNLKIMLNARRENNQRTEVQFMFAGAPRNLGGNFTMTTIGFASSLRGANEKNNYESDIFNRFLNNRTLIKDRLERQYLGTKYPNGGFISENTTWGGNEYKPANGDVDINSGDVLIPAFISAYTGKDVNSVGLSAFPSLLSLLPNWAMSYEGLSEIPFIKEKFKSIRLNHGYTCFYQVNSYNSFSTWMQADNGSDDLGYIRDVLSGNPRPSSPYNISSVALTEMFNPLIGVEGALKNNMTINAQFNANRNVNLNMSSYQIIESSQSDFIIGLAYQIDEFNKMIGIKSARSKDFNNKLELKGDLSFRSDQVLIRKIEERFTQATRGTTTLTLKIGIDYSMSRAITLRGFYDRIMNKPLITSLGYPKTDSNFGISIRFSLIQ